RSRPPRPKDAHPVKRGVGALLADLPIAQALDVVRAFSYFSHLVNIAEDVHQNRRRRAHALAGSAPQIGSLLHALDRLAQARLWGNPLARGVDEARGGPVLAP